METAVSSPPTPAESDDPFAAGSCPINGTALVVDDDSAVRGVIARILIKAGMVVREASDGRAARASLTLQPADVLITDLVMPDAEGIELIIEARQLHPRMPIIAISGEGRRGPEDFLGIARLLGAERTLAKPFTIECLLSAVRDALTPRPV